MARATLRAPVRRLFAVLACATLLLATGCDTPLITIRIPGFDSSEVEGIGIWRESDQGGEWELVSEIGLDVGEVPGSGYEIAYYPFELDDGSSITLTAGVERSGGASEDITVRLIWNRHTPPGVFRASAYNAAGHSALSLEAVAL